MRGLMLRGALIASLGLAAVACGDDEQLTDDTDDVVTPDAPMTPDAPIAGDNFTTFVTSMIEDRTAADTDAEPFATFATLPDDDEANDAAYAPLF